jgi:hypothetical protein
MEINSILSDSSRKKKKTVTDRWAISIRIRARWAVEAMCSDLRASQTRSFTTRGTVISPFLPPPASVLFLPWMSKIIHSVLAREILYMGRKNERVVLWRGSSDLFMIRKFVMLHTSNYLNSHLLQLRLLLFMSLIISLISFTPPQITSSIVPSQVLDSFVCIVKRQNNKCMIFVWIIWDRFTPVCNKTFGMCYLFRINCFVYSCDFMIALGRLQ